MKEALKAATALNRLDGEDHPAYLSRASTHFSSAMGDGFFKDLKVLFENIIPTNANCNREYQAICIAIVAIGISNFGTSMAKKFEHRKDVIGKSLEVAGAVLGIIPWGAGAIVNAVGIVAKTISDTVYEHKIDNAEGIERLGRRITSAFLLEKDTLNHPHDPASAESVLYTRILSAVFGLTH